MFNPDDTNNNLSTTGSRLIVLVPKGVIEASGFAQQVRRLALLQQCDVLFLALIDQDADVLSTGRFLATLEALSADPMYRVSSRQVAASNWVKAIKIVQHRGDKIVSHAGQLAPVGFGKGIPLEDYLREEKHLQVYLLKGLYPHEMHNALAWLRGAAFWLGSLIILALFSMVEYRVDHLMSGISRLVILAFLLMMEVGLIYELNKYTG